MWKLDFVQINFLGVLQCCKVNFSHIWNFEAVWNKYDAWYIDVKNGRHLETNGSECTFLITFVFIQITQHFIP